jgi:hypothetical protein
MRLAITCMSCFQADGKPSDEAVSVEMRDDGLYSVTCRRGHTTVTAIQEQKFEILFDIGAMALLDGYPREAVSSIASALERFYEYCIQVLWHRHTQDHPCQGITTSSSGRGRHTAAVRSLAGARLAPMNPGARAHA